MIDRTSLKVHLGRIVQKLPLRALRFIELPFVASSTNKFNSTPAVFVFALPRSGSTFKYQSICHGLEVGYLSTFWNGFLSIAYCRWLVAIIKRKISLF